MKLVKKSKDICNDLLILKYSCDGYFHVSYKDGGYYDVDVDDLVVDDYENYDYNSGCNLKLDGILKICYFNKFGNEFEYSY